MPGQFGNETVTKQNLKVVKVDEERNLLLIKGGLPGSKDSLVYISSSVKTQRSAYIIYISALSFWVKVFRNSQSRQVSPPLM